MNKRGIVRVCVIVAALLLTLAVTIGAEEKKRRPRPSTYIEARGGVFLPSGDWNEGGWEPKENFALALGYHFLPFLALEAGFHHFRISNFQTSPFYVGQKLAANGIVLTPKLIYPVKRLEFYLGASAGFYWIENGVDYNTGLSAGYYEENDAIWGFHGLAGASFDILRWLYVGLEGRYVTLLNFLDKSNITGWALTIGIGFRFL